ncbi:MAG: DUF2288 family protein [Thiohalomonadales bacterium]
MKNLPEKERRSLLNQETGKIAWPDLQIYFARGVLINIDSDLDLVTVADKFLMDDKISLEAWFGHARIAHTTDEIATRYALTTTLFWAIVVAPWVLVQEIPAYEA